MAGYREICAELATRISAGELRPGDELPGVRELARQWGTAASTVSHAQRELADAGLIELADRRRARIAPDAALAARRFLHAESVFTLAGSDDPALDLLARHLPGSLRVVTGAGSFAGLGIVRNGPRRRCRDPPPAPHRRLQRPLRAGVVARVGPPPDPPVAPRAGPARPAGQPDRTSGRWPT